MLPLKPPAPKKNVKNIKLVNFPIFDENGDILDPNAWPKYKGIFNGRVIIIKNLNDKSRLSNLVCKMFIYLIFRNIYYLFFLFKILLRF